MPPTDTQFGFVNVAGTETREQAAQRRRTVYSHVARTIHARARHARTAEHQALVNPGYTQRRIEQLPDQGLGTEASLRTTPNAEELSMRHGSAMTQISTMGLSGADPFETLSRPLSLIEAFLFHHYLTVVVPYRAAQCPYLEEQDKSHIDAMSRGWVQLASGDTSFLSGILLQAARHLSQVLQGENNYQRFARMAVQYKLDCMQAVSESISLSSVAAPVQFSDSTVAEVLILAADELALGNSGTCTQHIQGAARMLEMNGGKQTPGLVGFLYLVLRKYAGHVGLPL